LLVFMRWLLTDRVIRIGLAVVGLFATVGPAPGHAQTQPDWLIGINTVRSAAGLAEVTANTASAAGATNHSLYLVRNNFGVNGQNPHVEDPNLPGFTPDGATAGQTGDIAFQFSGPAPAFQDALAGWMSGGYHWEAILDPGLTSVGYGTAVFQDVFPNQPTPAFNQAAPVITSAQTLVLTRGTVTPAQPIMWPPSGGTQPFTSRTPGESPDPMANCPGYPATTGASLSLQLPTPPQVTGVTLTQAGVDGALPSCWFTSATVQFSAADQAVWAPVGRRILSSSNAVVIFSKQPLANGTYCVAVANASGPIAWSFTVGPTPAAPTAPCGQAAVAPATPTPTPIVAAAPPTPTPTTTTVQPQAPTPALTWAGAWNSSRGCLFFAQSDTQVSGAYLFSDSSNNNALVIGSVTGAVNGALLSGSWSEPPNKAGNLQLTLSADGASFSGTFDFGEPAADGGAWTGTRGC
jgi:hypothetical protein